jgi:hypothetical protein
MPGFHASVSVLRCNSEATTSIKEEKPMATIIPAAPGCRIRTTALVRKGKKTFEVSGFFGRTAPEIRSYLGSLGYFVITPEPTNNRKEDTKNVGDSDSLYVCCNYPQGRYPGRPAKFSYAKIIA